MGAMGIVMAEMLGTPRSTTRNTCFAGLAAQPRGL